MVLHQHVFLHLFSCVCVHARVCVCVCVCVSEALIKSTLAERLSDLSPVAQLQVLTMKQKLLWP